MAELDCIFDPGRADTNSAVIQEWDAVAGQTVAPGGFTTLTCYTTRTLQEDPNERLKLSAGGLVTVRQSGFCIIDYSVGLERSNATHVTDVIFQLRVNNTIVSWDGKRMQPSAGGAMNGVMPPVGEGETFRTGHACWLNSGDVLTPELQVAGGSVDVLANNALVGPGCFVTLVHLGPGVEPYGGSTYV